MTTTTCSCGRPTSGARFCERCEKTFSYSIVHVGVYYDDLVNTVATKRTRFGNAGATKGSIGKSQPLPVDTRFIDVTAPSDAPSPEGSRGRPSLAPANQLRYDSWQTIVAWTQTVMESSGTPLIEPACTTCVHLSCSEIRRRRHPARGTIPSMIRYLARQFRWIIRQDWAPTMADELLDLERRLARMVDRPADRRYAGKCSALTMDGRCEAELYARMDSGRVTCPRCKAEHDVTERRDILLSEAKHYLVTATEAAGALMAWTDYEGSEDKLIDRIRKWRDRGKLDVADVTSLHGRDRHLYLLGDIQDLMVAAAQDQQKRRVEASA